MYDTIIIGGGPAGLTAGIYAARGGLKTLLLEETFVGGQAASTHEIENFPGFAAPISGPDLMSTMAEQAMSHGVEIKYEAAADVDLKEKTVNQFKCRTIIIAAGAKPRQLGLPREDELRGRGVSYCATCDGGFFKGKTVAVVGGGDTAAVDSLYLSKICKKVYLIHRRDALRAAKTLGDRVLGNQAITVLWDSVVDQLMAPQHLLESVLVKNLKTQHTQSIAIDGLFVAVGVVPSSKLFAEQLKTDENGYIIVDSAMRTDIPGVFVAGDLRCTPLRQIVTACADGAVAANSAIEFLL